MGLFKRACALQGAARSDRPHSGTHSDRGAGLLKRSLHLLKNVLIDGAASAIEVSPRQTYGSPKIPETVPRTWKEVGSRGPEYGWGAQLAAGELQPSGPDGESADKDDPFFWLSQIQDGIEAPGQFFSLLTEHLKLKRAALLLYDPVRLVFAPWAITGFDETTSHRLRIPLSANEPVSRLAEGDIVLISDNDELKLFRQFFSFREYSNLKQLLLVPFIQENKFMGLLLVCETDDGMDDSIEVFTKLCDRAAGLLYKARERHLESIRRGLPEKLETLEKRGHERVHERVRGAALSCRKKDIPLIMIRVCLKKIADRILKGNPYSDPFRLREDISRLVLSLFQSVGSVFTVDRQRILILVSNMQRGDSDHLLYHLKCTLRQLFQEISDDDEIQLDEEVRIAKGDAEEAVTLLAELV